METKVKVQIEKLYAENGRGNRHFKGRMKLLEYLLLHLDTCNLMWCLQFRLEGILYKWKTLKKCDRRPSSAEYFVLWKWELEGNARKKGGK